MVPLFVHLHRGVHGLQEGLFVNTGNEEAGLVQGFRALGAGADAHGRERTADAGEEATFFGQGAAVGDNGEGVHLQAVIIVEAEGLVLDDAGVQTDPSLRLRMTGSLFQALSAAGVAAV